MQNTSLAEGGVVGSVSQQQEGKMAPAEEPDLDLASAAQGHPGSLQSFMSWEQATMLLCALDCCWWASPGTMVLPVLWTE